MLSITFPAITEQYIQADILSMTINCVQQHAQIVLRMGGGKLIQGQVIAEIVGEDFTTLEQKILRDLPDFLHTSVLPKILATMTPPNHHRKKESPP